MRRSGHYKSAGRDRGNMVHAGNDPPVRTATAGRDRGNMVHAGNDPPVRTATAGRDRGNMVHAGNDPPVRTAGASVCADTQTDLLSAATFCLPLHVK